MDIIDAVETSLGNGLVAIDPSASCIGSEDSIIAL